MRRRESIGDWGMAIVAAVVLAVVLSGCIGGIGGDGGDGGTPTPTETTRTTDGAGADGETTTATDADGAATDGTTASEGNDGDGGTTAGSGDGDDGGTTAAGGDGGDADAIVRSHVAGLQEAGGYTIEIGIVETSNRGNETTSTTRYTTQKVDLETGERYLAVFGFEYYQPPNSDTVYVHSDGETQQAPADQAPFFNFTNASALTGEGSMGAFVAASERTSGSTDLGPATVYVVDSVEDLPPSMRESLRSDYDQINGVRYRLFVDRDTGVLAKFDYRIEAVERDEVTIESGWEITELGPPEIETPEWVPDGRITAQGEAPALVGTRTGGSR